MSLFEQIEKDYIQAYKAKDSVRLTVLRLLKTAVKNKLVDLCRPGGTLDDGEMMDLIIKEGKQRQDSIEQYTAAGRSDLADKTPSSSTPPPAEAIWPTRKPPNWWCSRATCPSP